MTTVIRLKNLTVVEIAQQSNSLTEPIDTSGLTKLFNDKAGNEYVVIPQHLAKYSEAFHQTQIDGLPWDQKPFLLTKKKGHFEEHIAKGDGNIVVGVINPNGRYVGQAVVSQEERTTCIQSFSVAGETQGQGVGGHLLDICLEQAMESNQTTIEAHVHTSNPSAGLFLKKGYKLDGLEKRTSTDEMKERDWREEHRKPWMVYHASRPVQDFEAPDVDRAFEQVNLPAWELPGQQKMMNSGYTVVEFTNEGRTVRMTREVNTEPSVLNAYISPENC